IDAFCMGAGAAVCSALVAPSKTPTPPSGTFPWQAMLSKLPNNAFEKNTPARSFAVPERLTGLLAKGVELSAALAIAAGTSAALQHCLVAARRAREGGYEAVTPVPGISRAAGGVGVYGGLAANARLQAVAGLDRLLLEYVKVNTLWQVIGISTVARVLSQFALEDPWGHGAAKVGCSRSALQGHPTAHVPTPQKPMRKVRTLVKRRRSAADAGVGVGFHMTAYRPRIFSPNECAITPLNNQSSHPHGAG
ncbi:MAG: RETICULATA-related protein, partial [Chloroflexota bacterium]